MKRYDAVTFLAEMRNFWSAMISNGLPRYPYPDGPLVCDIHFTLSNLREDSTYEQIKAVLPITPWEGYKCTECNKESSVVIEMGESPSIDSATVTLCQSCLAAAVSLVNGQV